MTVYSGGGTEPFDYGTTATYECDPGYEMVSGDSERTCTDNSDSPDDQWSGTAAVCSGIYKTDSLKLFL